MKLLNSLSGLFFLLFLLMFSVGCGVKSRPLPPDSPAPLGRGQPNKENKIKNSRSKEGSAPSPSDAEGGK